MPKDYNKKSLGGLELKRRPAERGNSIESGWNLPELLRGSSAEGLLKKEAVQSAPMMEVCEGIDRKEEEYCPVTPIMPSIESVAPSISLPCKKKIVKRSTTDKVVAQQLFDFAVDKDALLLSLEQEIQQINEGKAKKWGIDFSKDPEEGVYSVPTLPVRH